MARRLVGISLLLLCGMLFVGADVPSDPWAHPRLFLTSEVLDTLRDRYERGGAAAAALQTWYNANSASCADIGSASRMMNLGMGLNYAIMYAMYPSDSTEGPALCYEMITNFLDDPPSDYDSLSIVHFNTEYNTRSVVKDIALMYDWCYNGWTADQRTRIGNYLAVVCEEMMDNEDGGGDAGYWGFFYPTNNFFYGHTMALLYSGYATAYEQDSALTWIEMARDSMFDNGCRFVKDQALDFDTYNQDMVGHYGGGLFSEGTSYGVNNVENMMQMARAVSLIEDVDVNTLVADAPEQFIAWEINALLPNEDGSGYLWRFREQDGDDPNYYRLTSRPPTLICANLCSDSDTAGWAWQFDDDLAKDFLFTGDSETRRLHWWFLWDDDLATPVSYEDVASEVYHMSGNRMTYYRTGDDSLDVFFKLRGGVAAGDHTKITWGTFNVYAQELLCTDVNIETASYDEYEDHWYHNGLYVLPDDTHLSSRLYEGEIVKEAHEDSTNYYYLACDVTEPYHLANPVYRDTTVAHLEAAYFVYKPDTLVLFIDRALAYQGDTWPRQDTVGDDANIGWRCFFTGTPTIGADSCRYEGTHYDVAIKRPYPADATMYAKTIESTDCVTDSLDTPNDTTIMVHALRVTRRGPLELNTVVADTGNVFTAGWESATDGVDIVVVGTTDMEADAGTGFDGGVIHVSCANNQDSVIAYVLNCASSTEYYYLADCHGGYDLSVRTTTSDGYTAMTSSADGVLEIAAAGASGSGDGAGNVEYDEGEYDHGLTEPPAGAVAATENNRDKILVVRIESYYDGTTAYEQRANDREQRQMAQIRQICRNRGIDIHEYDWDGDIGGLRTLMTTNAGDYIGCIINGGAANMPGTYTADDPRVFLDSDSTYNHLNTLVWWGVGARGDGGSPAGYISGASDAIGDRALLSPEKYHHFYTANYSGDADTLFFFSSADAYSFAAAVDPSVSGVDSFLTYANYPNSTSGYHHDMGFWSLTASDGSPYYYLSLADKTAGLIVDALLCKWATTFNQLYWSMDIDDFGMHMQGGSSLGMTPFDDATHKLTHSNFFTPIQDFFDYIVAEDLKITVGATARFVRDTTAHADSNQWSEWWALRESINDNPDNFAVAVHGHGYESPNDSTSCTFPTRSSYTAYYGDTDKDHIPTQAIIDSLYDDEVDSLAEWFTGDIAPYVQPPHDALVGYHATDSEFASLKDTIADWAAEHGFTVRAKYHYSEGPTTYPSTQNYRGAEYINAHYITNTNDTALTTYSDDGPLNRSIAEELYLQFWEPTFFSNNGTTGHNPGKQSATYWNLTLRALNDYEYSGPVTPISVLHFGGCKGDNQNLQKIRYVNEMIEWLEWVAGKDLYECVFSYEFGRGKAWGQVQ